MPETSPADTQVATAGPSGLLCERVSVTFGATRALRDVSVHVAPGEILGLMGHNGAGKSTLLKVGTGVVTPDSGRVVVNGKPASRFGDPRHFFDLGVTVIHQEPALAPNLSILDNLTLGQSAVLDDRRKAAHRAAEIVRELELYRPLNTPVGVLSLGERQIVDLARGLLRGEIRALLLDEPAAALGVDETRILHGRIKELAASGTAVVYVSHRLPDILDVCDRILVLRDGQVAMEAPRSHFTARSLATAIAPGLAESSAKPSGIKPAGPTVSRDATR